MPVKPASVFRKVALYSLVALQTVLAQSALAQVSKYIPVYPPNLTCGQITSGFGSMRDLDGSLRNAPHVGIDLGEAGDVVVAPADGVIGAIWQVEHEFGADWNLLLVHTPDDLNMPDESVVFYTEFDHLQRDDMPNFGVGDKIHRSDPIGVVRHPGNNSRFRAEVHMEVYALPVSRQSDTQWHDDNGIRYWQNESADLTDPLIMMSRHMAKIVNHRVELVVAVPHAFSAEFQGFVYPLLCD